MFHWIGLDMEELKSRDKVSEAIRWIEFDAVKATNRRDFVKANHYFDLLIELRRDFVNAFPSHDCWHGGYISFTTWRCQLGLVAGVAAKKLPMQAGGPPLIDYVDTASMQEDDPLRMLLEHSDCDGQIFPEEAIPLADRLEALLPMLPDGDGGGHIGNWKSKTQMFVDGLRRAAAAGEVVEFR